MLGKQVVAKLAGQWREHITCKSVRKAIWWRRYLVFPTLVLSNWQKLKLFFSISSPAAEYVAFRVIIAPTGAVIALAFDEAVCEGLSPWCHCFPLICLAHCLERRAIGNSRPPLARPGSIHLGCTLLLVILSQCTGNTRFPGHRTGACIWI